MNGIKFENFFTFLPKDGLYRAFLSLPFFVASYVTHMKSTKA